MATNPQLQRVADSALLKVSIYAITAVFLPLTVSIGSKALDRLERVEQMLANAAMQTALFEQRLQSLEKLVPQREAALARLQESTLRHEFAIQQLQQQVPLIVRR